MGSMLHTPPRARTRAKCTRTHGRGDRRGERERVGRDRGAGERSRRCRREGGNTPPYMGTLPLFKSTRIIRVNLKRRMRARSGEADSRLRGGVGGRCVGGEGRGAKSSAPTRTRTRTHKDARAARQRRANTRTRIHHSRNQADPARPDAREKTRKDAASATDEGGGEAGGSGGREGGAGEEGRWWGERGGRERGGRCVGGKVGGERRM